MAPTLILSCDCGRSSGRSRIGTAPLRLWCDIFHCGRSSGRSRIGTETDPPTSTDLDCGRSSGRSRIGTIPGITCWSVDIIAVALRGDRGLEHIQLPITEVSILRLRSLFGAIEDWNVSTLIDELSLILLRSLFGAIEDWN